MGTELVPDNALPDIELLDHNGISKVAIRARRG